MFDSRRPAKVKRDDELLLAGSPGLTWLAAVECREARQGDGAAARGALQGAMLPRRALFSCITEVNTRGCIRAGGHV